ncbi:hypothetical protein WOLCODRAFT_166528 [Wolfiporia cocos MD-104 SS10]|uniref:Uncharacterized protein n=1 Tax=Wolfiporia cocos (strain MD-104) TaxID=742152 RepID=A0A2H3J1L8_WOLCO|nr:hypothetical protein WOLCODRAFT_166528 [Wolfiporia cocos MD-104 SS10]
MRTTALVALALSATAVPAMSMPFGAGSQYTARNGMYDLLARSAPDGSQAVNWHGVIGHAGGLHHASKSNGKGKRELYDPVSRSSSQDGSGALNWFSIIGDVGKGLGDIIGDHMKNKDKKKGKREDNLFGAANGHFVSPSDPNDPRLHLFHEARRFVSPSDPNDPRFHLFHEARGYVQQRPGHFGGAALHHGAACPHRV